MKATDSLSMVASTLRAACLASIAGGVLVSHVATAEDKLSKFLLIKLARDQSQALCTSEAFNTCMGFTQEQCFELSEKALQQCIMPLPDTISLTDLNNDALELCPQKVYQEAGFSEDAAAACVKNVPNK